MDILWIIVTVVGWIGFVAMLILHFANPYPLIQIPDRGHRLFGVPPEHHRTILSALRMSGMRHYGTFNAGVRQTLMRDGFTVIASGEGMSTAGISIPTANPVGAATTLQQYLIHRGIETTTWEPTDIDLIGKLFVVNLPWGWSIAFRLHGKDMPSPKWED